MMLLGFFRNKRRLNSRTPQWFREWHSREFLPIKIRQDIMIVLGTGLFIAIIANLIIS